MASIRRATYRVQFSAQFGFDDAAALAAYLDDLGISHLYCSPYLQAVSGSTHGYDVVDYHRVSAALGGAAGHARMCAALRAAGLAQLLDIVPNHMAIGAPENPWWWDVLENGPSSSYAAYFDVDWDPPEARLRNTILLPVLGDQYGRVLDQGQIRLARAGARFIIICYEHKFPVAPKSLERVLTLAAHLADNAEMAFIAEAYGNLPAPTATDRDSVRRRYRDKTVLESLLGRLLSEPALADATDRALAQINRDADTLDGLLEQQTYRLAFWRIAGRDLGYRRFFDINTLAGLRMEDEQVFADTHRLILGWLTDGALAGVRVDHIDGLRDPQSYLHRLRAAGPEAWIVVEKILQPGEQLPTTWKTDGSSGYDFINLALGLFINSAAQAQLTRCYEDFSGETRGFRAIAREARELVMDELLGSELNRLAALFVAICERHRNHRDYTRHQLHEALRAVAARFPVYRTYMRADDASDPQSARYLGETLDEAQRDRADLDPQLFGFLRAILLQQVRGELETELLMRFQQFTGSVMAKAIEDTAFYRYLPLVCLNEVGGAPERFGVTVEDFHAACQAAARDWPQAMLASSTHDTKRSEDVRARQALLSELAEPWTVAVRGWAERNHRHWRGAPDRNAEYLFYQTLVGAWPIELERMQAYMLKAVREAKQRTAWTRPDPGYEEALKAFVAGAMADREFSVELAAFVARIRPYGYLNSLAQTLLKLTAPGVPDIYQGTELWDLSLVDPDNRRPVDFELRRRLLKVVKTATVGEVVARAEEGLPKLWTIVRTLALRRHRPEWFGPGSAYQPLLAQGQRAEHAVAFCRGGNAITIVPRLVVGLDGDWLDTRLGVPEGHWRNCLTGETVRGGEVRLAQLMAGFPVCLLARETEAA